jgi:flagellar biosynthesis GTPase FlhF
MHNIKNYDTKGIVGENSAGPLTTDTKANYDFSPNLFNSNTISKQNGGSNNKITSYYKMNGGSNSFESALHAVNDYPLAPNGGARLSYNTHSSSVVPSARPNHKHTGGKKRTLKKHKSRKHKKHKSRKHKSRKHKSRKHKSRKHKSRKHKSRKHKSRKHKKHKSRKHKKHKSRKHKKHKSRKHKKHRKKSQRYRMRGGSGDLNKLSDLPTMGVSFAPTAPISPSDSALAPGNFKGYARS